MQESVDMELLQQYVRWNSEEAFATLVARHVNMVYSVALRKTGRPDAAEEITQAVFIILANKACAVRKESIFSGWLYQTTRLMTASYLRAEIRRFRREQEAYMQSIYKDTESEIWQQIAPLLEDAMGRLSEKHRNAILLRFFEGKNFQEIGSAVGASENAAKKRVAVAVEKMRKYFSKQGVHSTTAVIAGALSANFVHAAPMSLAKAVTAAAIAKGSMAASSLTLVKGAVDIMAWIKTKTAIVIGLGTLLIAGAATWQVVNGNSAEGMKALNSSPPQVSIVPSKYSSDQGHGSLIDDLPPKTQWRYIGIHSTLKEIIEQAYWDGDFLLPSQIIWPSDIPGGFYDYIANLTQGSQEALQALINKKFKLVGKCEMRDMEVLLLELDQPNAEAMKLVTLPPNQPRPRTVVTHQRIHYKNMALSKLCKYLTRVLQAPVVDQTGLTGNYDFDFPDVEAFTLSERIERIKRSLPEEFGLKLVPGRKAVKTLIVEKAE